MKRLKLAAALVCLAAASAGNAAPKKPSLVPPKVGVKVGKVPPLGTVDVGAVKAELIGEVRSQVSLCAAVHALRAAPCASQALLQKLVPLLLPIDVSHVGIRRQDSAELEKLVKDGGTEAPPPELQNLPYDLDVSLHIPALQVTPGPSFDSLTATGALDLLVTAPKIVKTVRSSIKFSATVKVAYAPAQADCKAMDGGDSIRVFPHLSLVELHLDTLSTDRVWWAKLLPGDRVVKWIVNHLLGWAAGAVERRDARATVANAGAGIDQNVSYPLGFPICLGKGPCGGTAKPHFGWATAKVSLGKLGTFDYARVAATRPYLMIASSQFLCEAFEAAKSVRECAKPLFGAVLATALPLTLAVPRELERAAGVSSAPPLDFTIKSASLQAAGSASPNLQLAGAFAASIGDPKNRANTPFEVAATGDVSLGAVCDQSSFYLWNSLALTSLTASSAIPAWLTDGLGRAAVNAHLPAIDVCLGPAEVDAFGGKKRVDVCSLAQALAAQSSAGVAADAALEAILPLTVQPGKLLRPGGNPLFARAFQGISVALTEARLTTGKHDSLTASVAITKAGEADALRASATVAFALSGQCHAGQGHLRFTPNVTELGVAHLPAWLLQTTLLQLANDHLAKAPPLICIQGACRGKPKQPVRAVLPPPPLPSSSGCEGQVAR